MQNNFMALKDIYKKVEDTKANTPKDGNNVSMDWAEFVDEHLCLIKVLREGSREELLAEAKEQEEELKEKCKEYGVDFNTLEEKEEE